MKSQNSLARRKVTLFVTLLLSGALLAVSGCNRGRKTVTASPASQSVSAPKSVATQNGSACADGSKPQILQGKCDGKWAFLPARNTAPAQCRFTWGPVVRCPAGTQAIGYQASCYGETVKQVPRSGNLTPADCARKFGKFPLPNQYQLACCGT